MSTGLALFHRLCDLGNGLQCLREAHDPASETWLFLTCLLQELDAAIDMLVHSQGLCKGDMDDA